MERVREGRMHVVPMASMAIYWNHNYCMEFLDEMINFCGRLWEILYISLLSHLRWLAGKIINWLESGTIFGHAQGRLRVDHRLARFDPQQGVYDGTTEGMGGGASRVQGIMERNYVLSVWGQLMLYAWVRD